MLEKEVENSFLQLSELIPGCEMWKVDVRAGITKKGNWIKRKGKHGHYSGVSDLIMFYNGHTCFIEVKSPKRKNNVSEEQKFFLESASKNGSISCVMWDIEQLRELIFQLGKTNEDQTKKN